jgi:hypothetical protein
MKALATLMTLLLALPTLGDEVVLRDGRRIVWKSIVDDGEIYSVETKDGKKLTLKKSEVERIATGDAALNVPPLTGASFTMGQKASVTDIILKVRVNGDSWKTLGKALVAQATWPMREVALVDLEQIPEEYDLTLVIERIKGDKDFAVGIVAGGSTCAYHFDAWDGTKSALALIGGQESEAVAGRVFQPNKPRTAKIQVRKDALMILLDGKEFWKSRIDWKQVAPHSSITLKEKGHLFLVAAGGSWKVSSFILSSVK